MSASETPKGDHKELLARLDAFPDFYSHDGLHWYKKDEQNATAKDAAAAIRSLQAQLETERKAREEAERSYADCRSTLKDERYCHAHTIAALKNAASEEIKAANQRAEAASARTSASAH